MNNFLHQINSYIKEAINAGKYLYNGLSVTFDHLRRRPVTVQYPYEKLIPLKDTEEEYIMNSINVLLVKFA